MPLQFVHVCDLLTQLHSLSARQPPLPSSRRDSLQRRTLAQWFHTHQISVSSTDRDVVAVLSALLPARRTDRVYGLKALLLSRKLRRYLRLGEGRWQQLDQWKLPGRGDLGDCVERVQAQTEVPNPLREHEVTLEEVDRTLEGIAKGSRFSAPSVREDNTLGSFPSIDNALERVYRRLQSREAKWFTRMILKDYAGLELKEGLVFKTLHSRLPEMMKVQNNFQSAINSLRNTRRSKIAVDPVQETAEGVKDVVGPTPQIGVKMGRVTYLKGRSIKHVISMIDGRAMSAERKYDGEYFQIHIDLTKDRWIQVFSKSGKDSTNDREGIQEIAKRSLQIGRPNCGFSKNCILEGEMVVWSDETNEILEFFKIRKHVSRSGSFLGTALDSQPPKHEHLMLIYYDIMLLDNSSVWQKPQLSRRGLLEKIVKPIKGRAKLATRKGLQFDSPTGPKRLLEALAQAFVNGWEGLVLKPSNEPYFHDYTEHSTHQYSSCWIKLKKDYIAGLGDTADFAVFGAGYDCGEAAKLGNPPFKWTHFHLGCLRNKEDVINKGVKPQVTIFTTINQSLRADDVKTLNHLGQFRSVTPGSKEAEELFDFSIQLGVPQLSVVFRDPFVFEVLGSGFDRAPNQGFFTLRFPRVVKIHWDRDWKEAVAFNELQQMAQQAKIAPSEDVSADVRNWIEKLKRVDRGKNGRLASWDDSQEDLRVEELSGSKVNQSEGLPKTILVRRDTSEMMAKDRRLSNGEILEMDSHNMETSSGKGILLPNLSSSSSLKQHGGIPKTAEEPIIESPLICHKRTAETKDVESSKKVKKRRLSPSSSSSTRDLSDSTSPYDLQNRPLQQITNSARSRETLTIKASKNALQPNFSLVRKLGISSTAKSRARTKKSIEVLSSQCTTDRGSESTPRTNMTSQNFFTPSPSPERDIPIPQTNPVKTPNLTKRDTTNQYVNYTPDTNSISIASQPPIQIPNLQKLGAILSPCISRIPYLLEDLLPAFQIPISLFPSSPTHPPPSPPGVLPPFSKTPIILIESNRRDPTVQLMQRLISTMSASSFDEIQLWDWRLLEAMRKGIKEEYCAKVVAKRFFARIVWVWGVEKEGELGSMQIEWGDGKMSPVPRKFGERKKGEQHIV